MHTIISTWTDIIQQFFPIFTAPGAKIFDMPHKRRKKTRGRPRKKGKRLASPHGLYPSGHMVLGFASADPACHKPRPSRQRTRRFSFYDRLDDDRNRGFGMLQRPMGYRGHVQKHKTVSGWPAASDVQGTRAGTSGSVESVSVFDGVAVVSETKIRSKNFLGSALVQAESNSELCGCFVLSPPKALD